MKKFYLALLLICCTHLISYGQGYSLLNNSNYSPVNSVFFNPAKIADSKQKIQFNLFSLNMYIANDYARIKSFGEIIKTVQGQGEFNQILEVLPQNGLNKNMDFGLETRLPSFVISMGGNQSMALTNRARVLFNGNEISEKLMPILIDGLAKTDPTTLSNAQFGLSSTAFAETGLSYAKQFNIAGKHGFKLGVSGKYLWGGGNAQLINNHTNVDIVEKLVVSPGYTTIVTNGVDIVANVSNSILLDPANNKITWNTIADGRGQGFGADFGFEYEFRPKFANYQYEVDGKQLTDHSMPRYALKLGVAVTDMGSITYSKGKSIALLDATQNKEWTKSQIDNFNLADLEGSLNNVYPGKVTSTLNYRANLPSRLNINADVKVAKNFYIASNYMGALTKSKGVIDPTGRLISIAPRIEKPGYELTIPVTYSSRFQKTHVGIATRTGGFFIGTDDIGGAIGLGKWTSLNIYAGLNFAIGKKRVSDRDGDHISDKLDKCPKIAGPKENDGCPWPDVDKDGIPDKDDACPNLAGPASAHGCPDTDGDGISDQGDNCPTIPGPIASQGCPDADGDGIADKEDLCPTLPGSRDAKGCPDRDADGIPDREDQCPDLPGTVALRGCPDRDKDGIADAEDRCPDLAGTLALKGCPDRDNDGIADAEDACPDIAGPMLSKGCPDSDNDGILDNEDKCPSLAGPALFKGCPDTDKDGTPDSEDACPSIAGPAIFKGCPDRDGDSIPDSEDACPELPGPAITKGCPDKDGDGIADKDDKCIDQVGPASNGGCPILEKPTLTKVEEKIIFKAVADLQFETGKSVIKAYSYDSLDELAALMVKRPELTLILSGHTDNVGKPASNKVLSLKRAQAVKNYLMDAGVDGSRIAAVGYGSTKPIASNKTPQGRAKNRRVEFKVN